MSDAMRLSSWLELAGPALEGEGIGREAALAVLRADDLELPGLLDAALRVRMRYFGRRVNLHLLANAKSGMCGEDCAFCSQSGVSTAPVERYPLRTADEIARGGDEAARLGAVKYCIVTSGLGPDARELESLCEALRRIKAAHPSLHLCCSLGRLSAEQAARLKAAGADRINHNLETSPSFYAHICGTHAFADRVQTIRTAQAAGLQICSGGLIGMGESLEDRVELALALRDLRVDSAPVNFLDPREGTPLEGRPRPDPRACLKALVMFRLVMPRCDIRAAGGREACLRSLQPLALYAATSIFTQGYLTTGGQGHEHDLRMIEDAGFEVGQVEL